MFIKSYKIGKVMEKKSYVSIGSPIFFILTNFQSFLFVYDSENLRLTPRDPQLALKLPGLEHLGLGLLRIQLGRIPKRHQIGRAQRLRIVRHQLILKLVKVLDKTKKKIYIYFKNLSLSKLDKRYSILTIGLGPSLILGLLPASFGFCDASSESSKNQI